MRSHRVVHLAAKDSWLPALRVEVAAAKDALAYTFVRCQGRKEVRRVLKMQLAVRSLAAIMSGGGERLRGVGRVLQERVARAIVRCRCVNRHCACTVIDDGHTA